MTQTKKKTPGKKEVALSRQYPGSPTVLETKTQTLTGNLDALMCAHVTELEEQIEACAMVLRSSQPPYEGKYDVRWWVTGAPADGRTPVLVRWMKARAGVKLQPKPVKALGRQKPRSDGIWGFNHAQTVATLDQLSGLLSQREEIKELLRYKVIPLVKMVEARRSALVGGKERLNGIMQRTVEQLRSEGYVGVFPPEYDKHFPFLRSEKGTPDGLKRLDFKSLGGDEASDVDDEGLNNL